MNQKFQTALLKTVQMRQPDALFQKTMKALDLPPRAIRFQKPLCAPIQAVADQNQVFARLCIGVNKTNLRTDRTPAASKNNNSIRFYPNAGGCLTRLPHCSQHVERQVLERGAQNETHLVSQQPGNQRNCQKPTIHQVNRAFCDQIDLHQQLRVFPGALYKPEYFDRTDAACASNAKRPQHGAAGCGLCEFFATMPLRGLQTHRHGVQRDEFLCPGTKQSFQLGNHCANHCQGGESPQGIRQGAGVGRTQSFSKPSGYRIQPGQKQGKGENKRTNQCD